MKKTCKNCGSTNLLWDWRPKNLGGVVDGRIRMNEVGVSFFLGCEDCFETLKVINGDDVAKLLNDLGVR